MNDFLYYPNQNPQYNQQIQRMFPQPQGSVYSINTPVEIGNVPIGSTGLSVALCLQENLMYIKSFQGGGPVVMAYKITPYTREKDQEAPSKSEELVNNAIDTSNLSKKLDAIVSRLEALEKGTKSGGKFDGLL